MAFNIIVALPVSKIDWRQLSKEVKKFQNEMNIYPIPGNALSKNNFLGINISMPVSESKRLAITEMIELMISKEYKVVELYSHKTFEKENLNELISLFF